VPVEIYRRRQRASPPSSWAPPRLPAQRSALRAGLGVAQARGAALAEEARRLPRLAGRVSRVEMLGPLSRIDVVLQNGTCSRWHSDQPHHALAVTAPWRWPTPARLMILP